MLRSNYLKRTGIGLVLALVSILAALPSPIQAVPEEPLYTIRDDRQPGACLLIRENLTFVLTDQAGEVIEEGQLSVVVREPGSTTYVSAAFGPLAGEGLKLTVSVDELRRIGEVHVPGLNKKGGLYIDDSNIDNNPPCGAPATPSEQYTLRDGVNPSRCLEVFEDGTYIYSDAGGIRRIGELEGGVGRSGRVDIFYDPESKLWIRIDKVNRSASGVDPDGELINDPNIDDNGPCSNNASPIAIIEADPDPAGCGATVELDGSASIPSPGRTIVEWRWDIDGDGVFDDAFGPIVNEDMLSTLGLGDIGLQVLEDLGATGDTSRFVEFLNLPPSAQDAGPYEIPFGGELQLDGSGSSDPDEPCGDSLTFSWNLDDEPGAEATGANPAISWVQLEDLGVASPGEHSVELTVQDSKGSSSQVVSTFVIEAPTPPVAVINVAPDAPSCTDEVTLDASASFHPEPTRTIVEWRWDFDDSDGVPFTPVDFDLLVSDSTGEVVPHTYLSIGTFTVSLQVVDDNPVPQSGTSQLTVETINQTPSGIVTIPITLTAGEGLELDATSSFDPDEACGDSIDSFNWDLNADGVTDATGESTFVPWEVLDGLGWSVGDSREIELVVTDSFGLAGLATTTIDVLPGQTCLIGPNTVIGADDPPGGISFPGTSIILQELQLTGFSECVPPNDSGATINVSGTIEAQLSFDSGSTFTPYAAPVTLGGSLFPILLDDLSIFVGSTLGQTDPADGIVLDLLAAPTIMVGDTPSGTVVGGVWDFDLDLSPVGSTETFPSDPPFIPATSPPAAPSDPPCDWASAGVTDVNGDGSINHLDVGDANADGTVDAKDLNELGINWQSAVVPWTSGDFTGDGMVNASDLNILGLNWQARCD